jgi:hypothetical protein
MKQAVLNAIEFVKEYFENECSGHDYFHTIRVYKIACHIAEKENVTLVGFIRKNSGNIYHEGKVKLHGESR